MTMEKPKLLSCYEGDNAPIFKKIVEFYFQSGAKLLDCTYGYGSFWNEIDRSQYDLTFSDIGDPRPAKDKVIWNADAANLPPVIEERAPFDGIIYDTDYVHDPKSFGGYDYFNRRSVTQGKGHRGVVDKYKAAAEQAYFLLRPKGLWIAKTQDGICSGKDRATSDDITRVVETYCDMERIGKVVVMQKDEPNSNRWKDKPQQHPRKNHSYFLIYRVRTDRMKKRPDHGYIGRLCNQLLQANTARSVTLEACPLWYDY